MLNRTLDTSQLLLSKISSGDTLVTWINTVTTQKRGCTVMGERNMTHLNLRTRDGKIIFSSTSLTMLDAIEYAYKNNILLQNMDLTFHNLRHITLDGACFQNMNFFGCDLTGANLSECHFDNCKFSFCNLSDTCLCYSDITNCQFIHNTYLGADVSEALFANCNFTGSIFRGRKAIRPYEIIHCSRLPFIGEKISITHKVKK